MPCYDNCCVISSFITKPQPNTIRPHSLTVALYPLSSPNHNCPLFLRSPIWLRYILFHHQTTTYTRQYIFTWRLRYILFHHQTTTSPQEPTPSARLRYILFHHQTTTVERYEIRDNCCVISSFITKPQLAPLEKCCENVALYPLSSPNHNCLLMTTLYPTVALYPLSSPNHNYSLMRSDRTVVALYPLSSPNHNSRLVVVLDHEVALYPLSSPNHNHDALAL